MSQWQLPDYSIEREIGRGGMASVYLAVQRKFGRLVAIKVMQTGIGQSAEFAQRFVREARIVAQLNHPGIVQVYDAGVANDRYYLVMEYLRGGDLNRRLERGLHMQALLGVVKDLARALDYAHAKGYVHLDIKPENILFREDGSAVLSDFGIARILARQDSERVKVLGTPQYMSPEQAMGRAVDARSDLYSLGIVFYQMLTGDVPFKADTERTVGVKHLQDPVPRLPVHLAQFQPVLERLLAKQPDNRFQSGAELIKALDQLRVSGHVPNSVVKTQVVTTAELRAISDIGLAHDPRALRAEPGPERRARRRGRQRRYWFASAAALLLLAAGAGLWWHPERPALVENFLYVVGLGDSPELEDAWRAAQSLRRDPNQSLAAVVAAYRRVLSLDPSHSRAANQIESLARQRHQEVADAIQADDLESAEQRLNEALAVFPNDDALGQLFEQLTVRKRAESLVSSTQALLSSRGLQDLASANAAIQAYQEVLRLSAGHEVARSELTRLSQKYVEMADAALDDGDITFAMNYLQVATLASPASAAVASVRERISRATQLQAEIDTLIQQAGTLRRNGELVEPSGNNAAEIYRRVLATDPDNRAADEGLRLVSEQLFDQVVRLLDQGELETAQRLSRRASDIGLANGMERRVAQLVNAESSRQTEFNEHLRQARALLRDGFISQPDSDNAVVRLQQALRLEPANMEALALQQEAAARLVAAARDAQEVGMLQEAQGLLQEALALVPGNEEWRVLLQRWQAERSAPPAQGASEDVATQGAG
jgi:serine/threonine-protein kinase PpkA